MKAGSRISTFDRIMMAISFAEENEPEIAREILTAEARKKSEKRLGLEKRPESRPTMRV
ncbi:MAG: hypothetical protein HGA96_06090 [Desulfobulbaceae bacterium]|nr:hypothetical protein [Desulfobulbaceae bacterium]